MLNRALLVVALAAATACQSPRSAQPGQAQKQDPSAPVARIGGQTITAGELDDSAKKELAQLDQQYQEQRYQLRRSALEAMLRRRAFDAKAKQKGVSREELVEKEVGSRIPEPPEAEVKALYDRATSAGQKLPPLDQVKGDIARFIKGQKGQGAMAEYYDQLKKEQHIEILLPPYEPPKVQVSATGPSKGPEAAPVTIVEFSDYECPFCVRAEPTVRQVLADYPNKIRLVYRDYPLPMHSKAPKAAEAAQCAGDQGKYWEMHDRLFAANGKLDVPDMKGYAKEVGLDEKKFDACLDSGEKAKVVDMHRKAGEEAGVNGTPAFFINGRLISGAQPLDAFKSIIDQELGATARR
ncbi:MAG TPA: thioredoxin domain-containing protein [Anaeromyxobacteraceae bacterium]|nr:thioredoxin domain-containing protein [Anaeromyxobacteraceae bacterium]